MTVKRCHAARGQSLVEFALVLPVFLAVGLLCVQLCVLGVRWWQLNGVAGSVVRQAAAANGLHGDRLLVEIDTDGGAGHAHRADQARTADAPPPAGYSGTVTVRLTYHEPLLFTLFGSAASLGATLSQESTGAYGGLAP